MAEAANRPITSNQEGEPSESADSLDPQQPQAQQTGDGDALSENSFHSRVDMQTASPCQIDDATPAAFSIAQALSMVKKRREGEQKAAEEKERALEEQRRLKAKEKQRRRRKNQKERRALQKAKLEEDGKLRAVETTESTITHPEELELGKPPSVDTKQSDTPNQELDISRELPRANDDRHDVKKALMRSLPAKKRLKLRESHPKVSTKAKVTDQSSTCDTSKTRISPNRPNHEKKSAISTTSLIPRSLLLKMNKKQ